jgi:hypothetical protein
MSWLWFALTDQPPRETVAAAQCWELDGRAAGWLAAWPVAHGRPPGSLGIDIRAVEPGGPSAWVSLALAAPGQRVLFDDPAVSWALRQTLMVGRWLAMSTLTRDSSTIGGALSVTQISSPRALADDPFARLFPARALRVDRGFLGSMPPPVGPGIQRYGGSPWPWDRFPQSSGV